MTRPEIQALPTPRLQSIVVSTSAAGRFAQQRIWAQDELSYRLGNVAVLERQQRLSA